MIQTLDEGRLRLNRPGEWSCRAWHVGQVQSDVDCQVGLAVSGISSPIQADRRSYLTFGVESVLVILIENDTGNLQRVCSCCPAGGRNCPCSPAWN